MDPDRHETVGGHHQRRSAEYPQELGEEVTAELTAYLWSEWEADLRAAELAREPFEQLASLSVSTGIMWVKREISWEYFVTDVSRKLSKRDELLE